MIDWRDFNQVAQTLCQNPTEAFLRSAISRSYYAAYNVAVAGVLLRGCKLPRKSNSHETIREFYRLNGMTQVSSKLETLRKLRNTSDYRNQFTIKSKNAKTGSEESLVVGLAELSVKAQQALVDSRAVIAIAERPSQSLSCKNIEKYLDALGNEVWRLKP